jgi:MFS family permease
MSANGRRAGGSRGAFVLAVELGAFSFFGFFWGTFAILLADLSGTLDLSPGPLGFALFVGAAASILAMATLGWTADRLGRRMFLMISGGVMGAGIAAPAFAGGYAALLAALIVLYAASGLYDVGINAAAVPVVVDAQAIARKELGF